MEILTTVIFLLHLACYWYVFLSDFFYYIDILLKLLVAVFMKGMLKKSKFWFICIIFNVKMVSQKKFLKILCLFPLWICLGNVIYMLLFESFGNSLSLYLKFRLVRLFSWLVGVFKMWFNLFSLYRSFAILYFCFGKLIFKIQWILNSVVMFLLLRFSYISPYILVKAYNL